MADILFIALAFFAITGAIAMLVYRSPLFALLNATLLFMVQIIVYAGAIMALILFILMFLNIKEEDLPKEPKKFMLIGFGAILMIPLNILVLKAVSNLPSKDLYPIEGDFGTIKPVGLILYNDWIIAFELISILLLIALVGSVVLAKRRKTKITSKED